MKNPVLLFLLIVVGLIFLNACYYDKEQLLTPPKTVGTGSSTCVKDSFAVYINPMIQTSCANGSGCHGAGSSSGPGALTTYSQIKANATAIQASVSAGRMPLGSPLSASQIQSITCWVNNGALNN
ncbi:MAG: hypothetical protein JST58_00775 [Bacteroidetes bacterium]|jgi:hypothetical protein|nr:hypothetical protein [Bacteroidota bacterium]